MHFNCITEGDFIAQAVLSVQTVSVDGSMVYRVSRRDTSSDNVITGYTELGVVNDTQALHYEVNRRLLVFNIAPKRVLVNADKRKQSWLVLETWGTRSGPTDKSTKPPSRSFSAQYSATSHPTRLDLTCHDSMFGNRNMCPFNGHNNQGCTTGCSSILPNEPYSRRVGAYD